MQVKLSAEKEGGVKRGSAETLSLPAHLDSSDQKSLTRRKEAVV
jgi:hypothetical protein